MNELFQKSQLTRPPPPHTHILSIPRVFFLTFAVTSSSFFLSPIHADIKNTHMYN